MRQLILLLFTMLPIEQIYAQQNDSIMNEPCETLVDTATIQNKLYIAHYNYCFKDTGIHYSIIVFCNKDTVFMHSDYIVDIKFIDFNGDGHKDLYIGYMTNTPNVKDLALFDTISRKFVLVENFTRFPSATAIKNSSYYYSYHRSGCADLDWDSDLFYIENYKAIIIGKIQGRECSKENRKYGIKIFKIFNDFGYTIETLPIKTIKKYKDGKWGFIEEYWNINYKTFIPTI